MSRTSWPNYVGYPTIRGQQCKEQLLWSPGTTLVAGRSTATQHQWFLYFAWGDDDPTNDLTGKPDDLGVVYPRMDLRYPFQYAFTTREHALEPVARHFPFGFNFEAPFRYTTVHWYSEQYGRLDGPLFQLHWILFYGQAAYAYTIDPTDPIDMDNCVTQPISDDWDSVGRKFGGEIDTPPDGEGWMLMLLQTRIRFQDPNNPGSPLGQYCRPLIMYALDVLEANQSEDSIAAPTVFRAQQSNRFNIVHNPVNFPNHYVVLSPLCRTTVPPIPLA